MDVVKTLVVVFRDLMVGCHDICGDCQKGHGCCHKDCLGCHESHGGLSLVSQWVVKRPVVFVKRFMAVVWQFVMVVRNIIVGCQ